MKNFTIKSRPGSLEIVYVPLDRSNRILKRNTWSHLLK